MLYLTADRFAVFIPFGVIGFYRYLWFFIRIAASYAYQPIPLPIDPTYVPHEDVTIIVPTIDAGEEFREAANSWLVGDPKEILIVTEESMYQPLQDLADSVAPDKIRVLTVPFANKRLQMAHGIRNTTTDIIVFADDDAIWPSTMLPCMLACFEDQSIGGVGTSQKVQPVGKRMTVWEVLAAFRLAIRNFEIACSTHIDGGVTCLSGRTAAYRTVILKDPEFLYGFTHDFWMGKYHLNSGDDKFLTRWMVSHGWSTYIQSCKEAELLSTMKPNWRFLKQVLRWTRNSWRSDMRSLFMERHIWTKHPYTAYTMLDKFFNPLTSLVGPVLVSYVCYKSTIPVANGGFHLPWWNVLLSWFIWLTATRTMKLMPHLWHHPEDLVFVPAYILFGYCFTLMKIYALCTLHEVGWGTRAGIGDATVATAAMEKQQQTQYQPDPRMHRPAASQDTLAPPAPGYIDKYGGYNSDSGQDSDGQSAPTKVRESSISQYSSSPTRTKFDNVPLSPTWQARHESGASFGTGPGLDIPQYFRPPYAFDGAGPSGVGARRSESARGSRASHALYVPDDWLDRVDQESIQSWVVGRESFTPSWQGSGAPEGRASMQSWVSQPAWQGGGMAGPSSTYLAQRQEAGPSSGYLASEMRPASYASNVQTMRSPAHGRKRSQRRESMNLEAEEDIEMTPRAV